MTLDTLKDILETCVQTAGGFFRFGLETDAALDAIQQDRSGAYFFVEAVMQLRADLAAGTESRELRVSVLRQDSVASAAHDEEEVQVQNRQNLVDDMEDKARAFVAALNDYEDSSGVGLVEVTSYSWLPVFRVYGMASGGVLSFTLNTQAEC